MLSILIVAKPYEAELVRKACADLGHEAHVPDGDLALGELIEQRPPDLLVLSTRLGREDRDPSSVLAAVRDTSRGDAMPVLLLADEDDVELAVDRVLIRPVSNEELVRGIRDLVSNGAGEQQSSPSMRRIDALYDAVQEGDYFSLLEISPRATAEEVVQAHRRLVAEVDGDPLDPDVAGEYGRKLAEIREVLDEARQVLGVEALREAYRASLEEAE